MSDCTLHVLHDSASTATRQAVICRSNTSRLVRDIWTGDSNDEALAEAVLTALSEMFAQHDVAFGSRSISAKPPPISFRVRTSETALLNAARRQATGEKPQGYVQRKKIDAQAALGPAHASLFSLRPFADDAEHQEWVHYNANYDSHLFVSLGMANDVEYEYEKQIKRMAKTLPLGLQPPTHHFRSLIDDNGTLVGRIWFDINTTTLISYCFRLQIQDEFRGKGLAKVLLAHWELSAAELGATIMMLHVHEGNVPAMQLYTKYGFKTDGYTFNLVQGTI